jgi:presenilin-like A22 family membrane protease
MRGLRTLGLLVIYVGAQLVALALALPFKSEGLASGTSPNSPVEPLFIIAAIIIAPLVILWGVRRQGGLATMRVLVLVGIAGALDFTLYATFSLLVPSTRLLPPVSLALPFDPAAILASLVAVILLLALWMDPQWYVIDTAGFLRSSCSGRWRSTTRSRSTGPGTW